ncbi:putative reverse transcriptase domain-containing protein [Tanacetum coccineum]
MNIGAMTYTIIDPCPQKAKRCSKIRSHGVRVARVSAVRLQGAGNDFLQNVTCFGCGEKGHFKDKCPKAGNQQNDGARGRAYVVVENPQQNPNVVTAFQILKKKLGNDPVVSTPSGGTLRFCVYVMHQNKVFRSVLMPV